MNAAIPKFAVTKLSAVAAIIFMAAFLLVNALTFVEGTRRLAIIDGLNRLDIPQLITVIDEILWDTDEIIEYQNQEIRDESFCQLFNDLGREGFVQYGKVFYADISKVGCKMMDAGQQQDWESVKLHAHSIKSSVLNFGLVRLSSLAEKIEHECEAHGKVDFTLVREFPEAWKAATTALNNRFVALGLPTL